MSKIREYIKEYKQSFASRWDNGEDFKWRAVKTFQNNWNIDAENFIEMFYRATADCGSLLDSAMHFPRGMIKDFYEAAPARTKAMFVQLYDENQDVADRIENFINEAKAIRDEYGEGRWHNTYQSFNEISTYLWLRYPDKYFIYKYSEVSDNARYLEPAHDWELQRKGFNKDTCHYFFDFYNDIAAALREDPELRSMLNAKLSPDYDEDRELHTMAIDYGFWIATDYSRQNTIWFGSELPVILSADDWYQLLEDGKLFTETNLTVLGRMLHCGGESTCKHLSTLYGNTTDYYNISSSMLGKRLAKQLPEKFKDYQGAYWQVPFLGREIRQDEEGSFVWALRPELKEALERFDVLSKIKLHEEANPEELEPNKDQNSPENPNPQYFWLSTNPNLYSFSDISCGESKAFSTLNAKSKKLKNNNDFLKTKQGDFVYIYESYPTKQIIALGRIAKDYTDEQIFVEKTRDLAAPISWSTLRDEEQLADIIKLQKQRVTLHQLSEEEVDALDEIIGEVPNTKQQHPSYGVADYMREVYSDQASVDTMLELLDLNKNLILCGAPGVGKTYCAKRLAYLKMGEKDDSRIQFVQFHQNYCYEDFVIGYKPTERGGFELQTGIFYDFCRRAYSDPGRDYFFIIDEINRGNLSKIFGELLMAIEKDYRNQKISLGVGHNYSLEVPQNLYIIGMMNTADRSLAFIDYALRRRFCFYTVEPAFANEDFQRDMKALNSNKLTTLLSQISALNEDIRKDRSLGDGFVIGHSYFCELNKHSKELDLDKRLHQIVDYMIIPTLAEYWIDNEAKLKEWSERLSGALENE